MEVVDVEMQILQVDVDIDLELDVVGRELGWLDSLFTVMFVTVK